MTEAEQNEAIEGMKVSLIRVLGDDIHTKTGFIAILEMTALVLGLQAPSEEALLQKKDQIADNLFILAQDVVNKRGDL